MTLTCHLSPLTCSPFLHKTCGTITLFEHQKVGLKVDHDALSKIVTKYTALLEKAQEMPPTAQYRINIEKLARYRINAATQFPDDPEMVEELCNCGQVEELVQQADEEMAVMEMYLRNKWWELVGEVEIEYEPSGQEDGGHGDVEWDGKA
mmetsp:Transcript_32968/g.38371  ORF Transcript_32968/g.38371 Transcript_32968/m.38371 type:complete len:150 (+) Transcript_32968:565-1014(+)